MLFQTKHNTSNITDEVAAIYLTSLPVSVAPPPPKKKPHDRSLTNQWSHPLYPHFKPARHSLSYFLSPQQHKCVVNRAFVLALQEKLEGL
jgi:hypothetical protein